jgi:hypothetical protein
VYESVYDKFNAALLRVMKEMRVGVPLEVCEHCVCYVVSIVRL